MKNKKDPYRFSITLRENGLHSLTRGIESYEKYDKQQDKMALKDAILFLHHGIELLMKEILINHSRNYSGMIFEQMIQHTVFEDI